jgi:hypothetical protein
VRHRCAAIKVNICLSRCQRFHIEHKQCDMGLFCCLVHPSKARSQPSHPIAQSPTQSFYSSIPIKLQQCFSCPTKPTKPHILALPLQGAAGV